MGFHALEDEEAAFRIARHLGQLAFEVGVAFGDQGRAHQLGWLRCQAEGRELVRVFTAAIADGDHLVDHVGRGQVDHALHAALDHFIAVVRVGNEAAEQRWREFHQHVPSHGHDVAFALPR
ncbi:hypothetical protein D3C81_1306110 [compost metagenome]